VQLEVCNKIWHMLHNLNQHLIFMITYALLKTRDSKSNKHLCSRRVILPCIGTVDCTAYGMGKRKIS